ncbi:DUF7139 domain-containing protein [Halosimplex halobium]|uniref:DUF7139 domain-containing protein n=1 Tax=Halosimplex halobium TaxID=3396618 RepID=UPI003F55E67C
MSEFHSTGSTLDLMDFKNVRDGGIVETPTSYAMLIKVEPRDWLILSEERRESLYVSFLTYLRGLKFPTQILSMTTVYDPEPYLSRFEGYDDPVIGPNDRQQDDDDSLDESPLLDYGRYYHAQWLRNIIEVAEIRDRDFYVAVSVPKNEDFDDGFMDTIRSMLPGGGEEIVEDEPAFLEEVQARAQRVASKLPQTQVTTTILDTRASVLEVLYEVYHGEKPPISFTQGAFIGPDEDAAAIDAEEATTDEDEQDVDEEERFERVSETCPEPELDSDVDSLVPVEEGGYAHPELVDRVSKDRILRWYARNIGPVGYGRRPVVPASIYAGVLLSLLSVAIGLGSLGAFVWTMEGATRGSDTYWVVRTAAFAGGMASLPALFMGLIILLPTGRVAKILGGVGLVIAGVATKFFVDAYPADWNFSNPELTTFTVEVYAVGVFFLVAGIGLAVRSRRQLDLSHLASVEVAPDGGQEAQSVNRDEPDEGDQSGATRGPESRSDEGVSDDDSSGTEAIEQAASESTEETDAGADADEERI